MRYKTSISNKFEKPVLNFGRMPLGNGFIESKDFNKEYFFNMKVLFDEELGLFQLAGHPQPKKMFNVNYPFFTASSKSMVKHFEDFSLWVKKKYIKKKNVNLIEIGSNDCTFLNFFQNKNITTIGFEPAINLKKFYLKKKIIHIDNFFNKINCKKKISNFKNKVDIIIAANVICHIPNLKNLFEGVDYTLNKNGVFIFEEPYLSDMYERGSFDQIYDEHIYMFSVYSISKICKKFNFELVDCSRQETHGGSMRYVVARVGQRKIQPNVNKFIKMEVKKKHHLKIGVKYFKKKIIKNKKRILKKIKFLKKSGTKIYGYAATSKSTTVLNYFKLNSNTIDGIFDSTPEKIGKFSPGVHIPVLDIKNYKKFNVKLFYLFAWNHSNEIFKKENKFLKNGGKFICHVYLKN
jgi:methylation protein EvaC